MKSYLTNGIQRNPIAPIQRHTSIEKNGFLFTRPNLSISADYGDFYEKDQ